MFHFIYEMYHILFTLILGAAGLVCLVAGIIMYLKAAFHFFWKYPSDFFGKMSGKEPNITWSWAIWHHPMVAVVFVIGGMVAIWLTKMVGILLHMM